MSLSTVDAFKHISAGNNPIELTGDRLRALQIVLTGMLRDIDEVCRENRIPYTLSGGTCLGAVRHEGFIPWDDDVDINMTREGYRRFAEFFLKRYGDKYWLHDCGRTPGYELAFPRVRLKGTVVRSREDYDNEECGAYIDIFIIENAPSNGLLRALHGAGSMALGLVYSCRRFAAHAKEYLELAGDDDSIRSAFNKKIVLGRLFSFRSAEAWTRTWDWWNALCKHEDSELISIPAGRKHYFGELYGRSDFFPVSQGAFESLEVPLPASPDPYMRALYGPDYMIPPDVGDRERHVVYEFDLGRYA